MTVNNEVLRTVTLAANNVEQLDKVVASLGASFPGVAVRKVWKKKGTHARRKVKVVDPVNSSEVGE